MFVPPFDEMQFMNYLVIVPIFIFELKEKIESKQIRQWCIYKYLYSALAHPIICFECINFYCLWIQVNWTRHGIKWLTGECDGITIVSVHCKCIYIQIYTCISERRSSKNITHSILFFLPLPYSVKTVWRMTGRRVCSWNALLFRGFDFKLLYLNFKHLHTHTPYWVKITLDDVFFRIL